MPWHIGDSPATDISPTLLTLTLQQCYSTLPYPSPNLPPRSPSFPLPPYCHYHSSQQYDGHWGWGLHGGL